MKLIVGLGNPGTKYSQTRHNIGRLLVEFLSQHHQQKLSEDLSLQASCVSFQWDEEPCVLAIPSTYMNVSGRALFHLVEHFEIHVQKNLLVLVDDVALPFGRLRLRGKGSDGGHNGLTSIEDALGTQNYARLRIGVGPEEGAKTPRLESYVLESFDTQETKQFPELLKTGLRACELWLKGPIEKAMSAVNPLSD